MGMIEDLKNCKSCAERREQMKKWFSDMANWARHRHGPPPIPGGMPPTVIVKGVPQTGGVQRFALDGTPLAEKVDTSPPMK